MTAVRTQTLLARHIGERIHVVTTGGGITGTLNSVAYIHENDPQPSALHLVAVDAPAARPGAEAPVSIPWHAVVTFARMPDPDIPALSTRCEIALDELVAIRDAISTGDVRGIIDVGERIIDVIATLEGGEAP